MHSLQQKKSGGDFSIWKQIERILSDRNKLNMDLNPIYFKDDIITYEI